MYVKLNKFHLLSIMTAASLLLSGCMQQTTRSNAEGSFPRTYYAIDPNFRCGEQVVPVRAQLSSNGNDSYVLTRFECGGNSIENVEARLDKSLNERLIGLGAQIFEARDSAPNFSNSTERYLAAWCRSLDEDGIGRKELLVDVEWGSASFGGDIFEGSASSVARYPLSFYREARSSQLFEYFIRSPTTPRAVSARIQVNTGMGQNEVSGEINYRLGMDISAMAVTCRITDPRLWSAPN